jgi:glycosyltransferase involved in cell wall biosynthesis
MRQSLDQCSACPDGAAPKVSVVVPTFNRAGLLKETVESILAQTYTDFELIIVDNMSVDGTEEYIAGLVDPRIRYFRHPNCGVIAVNRNYGIRQARGEYVALCDDDDLWLPEKLQEQVQVLEGKPDLAMCYTNATVFDASGVIDNWMMKKKVFLAHYRHLLLGNFIPNSTVLVRRDLLAEFGYLDEDPRNMAVEDYKMWLKIASKFELFYVDSPLIRYRVHNGANSKNLGKMARKTMRIVAGEGRKNRFSPFFAFAFGRACIRAVYHSLF